MNYQTITLILLGLSIIFISFTNIKQSNQIQQLAQQDTEILEFITFLQESNIDLYNTDIQIIKSITQTTSLIPK